MVCFILIPKNFRPYKETCQKRHLVIYLFSTLLKVESVDGSHNMLYTEYQVYSRFLKGVPGFARVYRWAHTKKYNYMVMELLGKDLGSLFKRRDHRFSLDTVCLIAVQVLSRLEKYSSNGER